MENYANNSDKARQNAGTVKTQTQPVVTGKAKVRKKPSSKFGDRLLGILKSTAFDTYNNIIKPAIKKTIVESCTTGLYSIVYPDGRGPKGTTGVSRIPYTSYNSYARGPAPSRVSYPQRGPVEYDDIRYDRIDDAQKVLDSMCDKLHEFGIVSIGEMYEFAGVECPWTYQRYGWDDLRSARISNTPDGFTICLPRPKVL